MRKYQSYIQALTPWTF